LQVGVHPRVFRVEDISNNNPDERVAETQGNVGGEIFDTWVNFQPVSSKFRKLVNREVILHLGSIL
jgi:hypothetical protein